MITKRRFVTRNEVPIMLDKSGISHNNVVYRLDDVTDEFYHEVVHTSDTGDKAYGITDPIRILFAQERINNLGYGAIEAWIDSLSKTTNDPLYELRQKCSDDDLKKIIKSRHIQQPCEVVAWARMCEADMQQFNSELQALQQQQISDTSQSVDNQLQNE